MATNGRVTVLDPRVPRTVVAAVTLAAPAVRAFFFPDAAPAGGHLTPADVIPFGPVPPELERDSSNGVVIALARRQQWQSGAFVRTAFAANRSLIISGEIQLPLTDTRWQAARVWVIQPAGAPATAGNGDIDGFTRDGMWERPVCALSVPRPNEPQQRGLGALLGGAAERTFADSTVGGQNPVPFSLEFDGGSTCIARVGAQVVTVAAHLKGSRPLVAAVTGSAVATRGVVSALVVRGTAASSPH